MRKRVLAVAGILLGLAVAAFPQCFGSFKQGIVPVVAKAAGGGGSYWQTDLILSDVGGAVDRTLNRVEIWVQTEGDSGSPRSGSSKGVFISVPAGGTVRVADVMTQIEKANGGTAIPGIFIAHIDAQRDVVATARIFTRASARDELQAGFGQGLPALPYDKGMQLNEWARFPVPLDIQEARVNVGVANTGWNSVEVTIRTLDETGAQVNSQNLVIQKQEVKQVTVNADLSGYAPGIVEIKVTKASGPDVYAYVSVVDNVPMDHGVPTSDPSFYFLTR